MNANLSKGLKTKALYSTFLGTAILYLFSSLSLAAELKKETISKEISRVQDKNTIRVDPKKLKQVIQSRSPGENQTNEEVHGGTGVYVLDNVDFNPVGGARIEGLKWNNQTPFEGYYEFEQNSYVVVSGTVHGEGLITGTGRDGWTFHVTLDTGDLLKNKPASCSFSKSIRPQTTPEQTGWKYQVLVIFLDTATKPECFEFFESIGKKPLKIRRARIVGPGWPGKSGFKEPQERLYNPGPMLPLSTDITSGHDATLWQSN
ncbi:hypothetical protein [Aliikangiella sp. G2MR2-5]|uniref:hypothetical protein n=1 Tax=Aliikangiella sp. G2MR2-5 TaxID=2788943 RepID=UPI0018A89904|nr:hypothetical protein [Aliikangiella sp. G2MR2-5]